jgi:hypothetical protein
MPHPDAGVPHLVQNPCPSSSGLPQFLQKPAILASGDLYHVGAAFAFSIVPEPESTGKRVVLFCSATDLRQGELCLGHREFEILWQ